MITLSLISYYTNDNDGVKVMLKLMMMIITSVMLMMMIITSVMLMMMTMIIAS